ncbi:MAG: hypothetical protein GF364_11625 [Candidatus Lokiarchaeota archaeon]|nr:hypothetical protein [Candidatus Lokiarchaeota archaeon]
MKLLLIGDDESTILFHLVGLDSIIYDDIKENFEEEFSSLIEDPEIGFIILTESVLMRHKKFILNIKMTRRRPIIVEIPQMIQKFQENYVNETIKQFIGINLEE